MFLNAYFDHFKCFLFQALIITSYNFLYFFVLYFAESDDCDRLEFFKQLKNLRPDANIFLCMLNETRRQVRELRGPSRQHSAIQAYR